ncbi:MAG: hypothetical protein R2771_03980 [Saprospiraceae bacterium]
MFKYYVKYETNSLYGQGIEELKSKGFEIIAIVCDGRKGLIQMFKDILGTNVPVSSKCNNKKIFDKASKTGSIIELMEIMDMMKNTDKESFTECLMEWHDKWKSFLNERTINEENGKSHYTHKN